MPQNCAFTRHTGDKNPYCRAAMVACFLAGSAAPVSAGGFYVSSELGLNSGQSLETAGVSNDRASVCDGYINPQYATVESAPGYQGYNCTGPGRGATGGWNNHFGSEAGVFFGAALGYRVVDSRYRVELEYAYRDTGYDERSDIDSALGESDDKLVQELVRATDGIGSMTSHNLFANLYLDFVSNSRFTPYIGVGVGVGFTDLDYTSVWARNSDVGRIDTGAGLANAADIQANLAGTTSVAQKQLSDTLWGYQLMLGVDYALTESLQMGIKARWVDFESFRDDGLVWDPLRGHPPYLRTPEQATATGGEREFVEGSFSVDAIEMLAISLNLKYAF